MLGRLREGAPRRAAGFRPSAPRGLRPSSRSARETSRRCPRSATWRQPAAHRTEEKMSLSESQKENTSSFRFLNFSDSSLPQYRYSELVFMRFKIRPYPFGTSNQVFRRPRCSGRKRTARPTLGIPKSSAGCACVGWLASRASLRAQVTAPGVLRGVQ